MKILIGFLLTLFISGQAYSDTVDIEEYDWKLPQYDITKMESVCYSIDSEIVYLHNRKKELSIEGNNLSGVEHMKEEILKRAKLYHYLDCSDFRNDYGMIPLAVE